MKKKLQELKENLDKVLGKDADLSIKVDASIIGGYKIEG